MDNPNPHYAIIDPVLTAIKRQILHDAEILSGDRKQFAKRLKALRRKGVKITWDKKRKEIICRREVGK